MIYLFNNNEEMIRIIPNSAIKRMYQTQKLTDENYISDRLDVEIQALNDEELSELEYMAIDDIENPQRFHYYFIVKETTEHQITSLTGVQSGIEELRKTPVYDMRPTNRSPKLIADRLLEGTNWQAGYTTDDVGTISTNFYYTDVFSALKKMCMAFGIEMQFFVEITTNRIGARYIEFRKRTGKSVGKRVVYGHNALKIVKEVEKTNTVTALIGRGKGVQVSESDEGNIGYGRKIGFENVEWKTSSGAPVDKPLGQEFVEIPELTLQYGIKNSNGTVRPKIGFVEFQDEESETRLIDRTYNALLELSRPQVLLETSSVYLPDTGIGDTVNVVRHDRDLRYQTRVFEITWDRLANQAVDMKLGDRLGESENKRISRISNQVSGNISTELGQTIDELVDNLTSADGKNTNWYTEYDPMENPDTKGLVRVNDNWYQPDPEYEGEFILKQWNGEMWVEILRTSGNQELVRRFEEIEQQAQDLADDIEASDQKADEAKEVADLAKSAVDAYGLIMQETADKMVTVEQIVADAESNASEALSQAGQAITDAQTATGNAQTALSKASDVESTVSTLSKEVDTVAGKVSLKAEQTEVDTISGTVSTHTTTLSQHATAISSKAEQEEVDTVKGTVSTHTSTLEQHATDISARLTESQVDNLVNGKGYSTVSYIDTQMSATAEGIRTELTKVEGKIPQSYTEENLVVNSKEYVSNTTYLIKEYSLTKQLEVGKEYTIVLEGGIGLTGSDQQFGIYFDDSQSSQGTLQGLGGGIYKKTFTLLQTGPKSGDKSKFTLFNLPNNTTRATIKWIKLVEGEAKDNLYRPSMNDLLMENEFTSFKTDFDVKAEGWEATTTYVTNNKTKMNSLISNADGWASTISYVDTNKTKINSTISTVDSYVQTIGTNGENIANMVMTDSMFNTRVLESIGMSDRNYAVGTTDEIQSNQRVYQYSGNMQDNTSKTVYTLADLGAKVGDTYTASIYIGNSDDFGSGLRIDTQSVTSKYVTPKTMHGFATITFTVEEGDSEYRFYYANTSGTGTTYSIEACKFKIERGNKRTEWTPAIEDMATTQQVSDIKQTADSIQALVGNTKDSVARAVMTSNLWETEVSKVIDEELEQEFETVLSPVHVLNETEHNSGETFSLGKYFNYSGLTRDVPTYLQDKVKHVLEITMPATQNKGQFVYVQTKNLEGKWVSIGASFNLPTGQFRITHEFTSAVFSTSTADYRLVLENGGNPAVNKIYSMRIYRNDEVQVPINGGNTGAISTKITQLYDMINLSVLGKDGALSRIAMGEEGIQIDGKLLHITAKTYIDDAVIKSAMIDTLDAGKITTGELNASLIRVVNLDASSITGNEASFIQALFSGTKSTLQITGSGVSVLDNAGRSSTYLDSTGIEISRSGINLGKMQYVTNVSETGDLNGMHGIVMRPNRGSYFAVSYLPKAGTTESVRRFAVSGRTGNVYISGLIKPSEQQIYGIDITWGNITGRGTNVRIMNHDRTGGIQIDNGDIFTYQLEVGVH